MLLLNGFLLSTITDALVVDKVALVFMQIFVMLSTTSSSSRRWAHGAVARVTDGENACGVPRLCYSCASVRFGKHWDVYQTYFRPPANFTSFCDPRLNTRRVPLVECKAPCLTLIEPVFLMGKEVSKLYYRGCFNGIFKSRETEDVALAQLLHSGDNCKNVPRNILYNRNSLPGDNMTLCSCACDKCNIYPHRLNTAASSVVIASTDKNVFGRSIEVYQIYISLVVAYCSAKFYC